MNGWLALRLRGGSLQGVLSLVFAGAAVGVIVASSWSRSQTAGRLAIAAMVMLVIALIIGSGRLVSLTALPLLVAALITTVYGTNPAWVRAFVVGVLWYLSAELAWGSIEHRDGVRRTAAHTHRRIEEINTVVLVSLIVTVGVVLLATTAPARTVSVLGFVLVAMALAANVVTRRLQSSSGNTDVESSLPAQRHPRSGLTYERPAQPEAAESGSEKDL